ncbi:MAG TPA: YhdP family protein [Gallionella sp.]|nr:YhdP family protein [Gallionella sp.]
MLNSLPVRLLWHSLNWLTRLTIVASGVIAVLMAFVIIGLRYWVLPDIEQYHDQITASFSSALGNPVTIGKIEGDWQGLQPRLNLSDVRILDEQRNPALVLPRINGSISWMSLLTSELRLASLEIDRPELLVRRDAKGKIFIGGVALSREGGGNDLSNWLLHQSRMIARDALIVWVDEQRGAAPLVLKQVNLRIENLFSHHRFALRALPPESLSTPLDVRGDFYGTSFASWSDWRGQLFTQLDYTDVTAWRPWLDLPSEFSRGRGALRGWLTIKGGRLAGITADLDLHNVVTKLAGDVPEMAVLNLRGRAAWQDVPGGFEVSTRKLALSLRNGLELEPTDFYLRLAKAIGEQPAGGEIRADRLQLETLVSLANFLPLEASMRTQLATYAPRGQVSNLEAQWQGSFDKIENYTIKGQFDNLALRQVGDMPGFSGLSVDVDGGDASGRLNINSRRLVVNAPGVMREPLSFVTLTGQANWRRRMGELSIRVDNVAAANEDLAGNLYGSYQTRAGTLGFLDLTVSLTRGDVKRAARYTPLVAVGKEASDWLNSALLAGHTENLRVRVKGNLSDFPVDGSSNAVLEIGGHAEDVVLEFDKKWPRLENINGDLLIRGNKLEVKSPSATMLGASLKNFNVTMPDMLSADLPLDIKGEADAASNVFLQFIQQSPVRGYIDGFTDGMSASGEAHLDLLTHVLLLGDKPATVAGTLRVRDNDIDLGDGVPLLRKTNGALVFTESGMQANDVTAEILGGPATLKVETLAGGLVHAAARGRSNLEALRTTSPLLNYVHGGAAWDADVSILKKSAQVVINSNLQGISSELPQPFAKLESEVLPLRIELKPVLSKVEGPVLSRVEGPVLSRVEGPVSTKPAPVAPGSPAPAVNAEVQNVITIQLGKLVGARLLSREENGAMTIKRGTVNFGQAKWPDTPTEQELLQGKDGIWLTGTLPVLSIQGWDGLAGGPSGTSAPLPIVGAKLQIDRLTGYGQVINNLRVDATRRGEGLAAQLSSAALNGEVEWRPRGYEGGGLLSARLRNLHWAAEERAAATAMPAKSTVLAKPAVPVKAAPAEAAHPDDLPALDIAVDNLQILNRHIGRLELFGHPDGRNWRLQHMHLVNPDGSLTGDGVWLAGPANIKTAANEKTQLNLLLEITDAGKILDRSGYPNTVKKGSGKLAANLSWAGSPADFSYASLDGTLKLDTGKGQFLKMDPGIGKLLSILSLQALPKHITLDFTDVFSDGFQFDNINGNATVRRGVMETQDFHIDGSAAKVTMKGSVDLNRETQNLRVTILPAIGDSVSLLGVLAAGPAIGIGSLIVNKVLGNPLDKLVSFEYNISGTWDEPTVVKVGRTPVKAPESNLSN